MNLFQRMFPQYQRENTSGITLGDVLVLILSAALLLYTGWRSFDIIRHTLPSGDFTYTIIAIAGLFALDVGMIAWALVWMLGSTTEKQDWLSLGMWGIDSLGVLLAVLADTFLYTPAGQNGEIVQLLQTVVWWAVPALAVTNGLATIVYHLLHPAVAKRREERRLRSEIEKLRMQGEYDQKRAELEADLARELVHQRRQHLQAYQGLVALHRQLETLEQALAAQLMGDEPMDLSEAVRQAILKAAPPKSKGKPGPRPGQTVVTVSGNHRRPHSTASQDEMEAPNTDWE